jgi:hypothetical protein
VSVLLKLPGLRKYLAEIRQLRADLSAAKDEIQQLRAEEDQPGNDPTDLDEYLKRAKKYEYYWVNASKKIDVRRLVPFGELARRVVSDGRTYLNVDRLYTLWQLVHALPPSTRAVAEVGACRGGSARFVAETLRLHQREMPFYVCDTFEGHVEVDEAVDGYHRVGVQFAGVKVEKVANYLAGFPFIRLLKGDIRDTAATFDAEHAFGLVHIDVDVFPATRFCLEFFAPRIVAGGAMLVDDYGSKTCRGVQKAVDEFAETNDGFRLLHLLTGQAVLIRWSAG